MAYWKHQLKDRLEWEDFKDGSFTVKKSYAHLCSDFKQGIDRQLAMETNWRSKLPTKVICFVRITSSNTCHIQDNPSRRSIQIVNRCYMCRLNSGSVQTPIFALYSSIWYLEYVLLYIWTSCAYENWCLVSWKIHQKGLSNGTCCKFIILLVHLEWKEL